MSNNSPKYSDYNYEDKVDYEVVKSYETVNRLSQKNRNLFSLLFLIVITLISLIIFFQFQTIKKLDKKVQTLDEKVQTLDEKVQTLDEKVQTLDEKVQTLDEKVQTLDEKVQTLEK